MENLPLQQLYIAYGLKNNRKSNLAGDVTTDTKPREFEQELRMNYGIEGFNEVDVYDIYVIICINGKDLISD